MFGRGDLDALGFVGFISFGQLPGTALDHVPEAAGVYAVVRESDCPQTFVPKSTGGRFKEREPSVVISILESKWVESSQIVYVGKGENLQRRLTQYLRFGASEPVGHWGGRYIWQLRDSADLLVAWRLCKAGETAGELERKLLTHFKEEHGRLPYANIADPR